MKPEDYRGFRKFHSVPCKDGIRVRVIEFSPAKATAKPVLFIPGWVTRLEVMYDVIKVLLEYGFPVYYFESRDKKSSEIPEELLKPETFTIAEQAEDLRKTIEYLAFQDRDYYLFSSSYGCLLATHLLNLNGVPFPKKAVLVVPTLEIKFSWWQKLLIRMPRVLEKPAISIVELYMRKRFANPKEPEEHYKFKAQLYEFDLRKVQLTAIALDRHGAQIKKFRGLEGKTLVIAASLDLLHPIENVEQLADGMGAIFLDLLSNKFTHGELGGRIIAHFFKEEKFDPTPILQSDAKYQDFLSKE